MHAFHPLGQPERELAIAAAQHRRIHGKANRLAARRNRALHHVFGESPVALDIKLEPDRLLRVAGNLID